MRKRELGWVVSYKMVYVGKEGDVNRVIPGRGMVQHRAKRKVVSEEKVQPKG